MDTSSSPKKPRRRPYMVAMVLGTALSALGATPAVARDVQAPTAKSVADISRYCIACWRNARLSPDCWTDCTQEVFTRLLERLNPDAWDQVLHHDGDERREFIRAIDAVKKRTQRTRKFAGVVESVADRRDLYERHIADERAAVEQAATELLSARQQQILRLSFEGWSVQEIADEVKAPAERISDEKYKAIRKLRAHLADQEAA
jgi:RNA polymerase sigma factor (sigma-70 family)